MENQNGYWILEHLSDIELYYTTPDLIQKNEITLTGDEFHHAVKVMRNIAGNKLYITAGEGKIFLSTISEIKKNELIAKIISELKYKCFSENITFCIPKLKNPDRLKFAIEKCVELGITEFIIFESMHTISKTSNKERLEKIALAAMKQSLRSFLPCIGFDSLKGILSREGDKLLFDQSGENYFNGITEFSKPTFFIFGPEGGFDSSEIELIDTGWIFRLSNNRLRTETAVVKCASLLNLP